ncbi:MAG: hypothetical protein Q8K63_11690 [Acidimicrobiales bacterium]|nr:hypothetical protein [Acidimicrobiales bacterium]
MLLTSLIVSIVLTIGLNLAVRAFPHHSERAAGRVGNWVQDQQHADPRRRTRVRVFFPWKAMLIGSIVLTIVLNLLVR